MTVRVDGDAPLKFEPTLAQDAELDPSDTLYRYTVCAKELLGDASEVWGNTTEACLDAYAGHCVELLACAQGHPDARPKCPHGAGRAGRCL